MAHAMQCFGGMNTNDETVCAGQSGEWCCTAEELRHETWLQAVYAEAAEAADAVDASEEGAS